MQNYKRKPYGHPERFLGKAKTVSSSCGFKLAIWEFLERVGLYGPQRFTGVTRGLWMSFLELHSIGVFCEASSFW